MELDCLVVLQRSDYSEFRNRREINNRRKDQTGALVGYMKGGLVQYCYNEGTIDMKSGMISGGLVGGGENGKIANCYNRGMVTGTTYAAGIIGFADKDFIVENCYNNGMIYSTGFTPAGVIGYLCSGRISNCYNAGLFVIDDTSYGSSRGY